MTSSGGATFPLSYFSTPFTGFLFATSAGLAPLPFRLNAHLKVAPAQCDFMVFIFSRIFRPCPTTVDPTSVPVMGRSSSTPSNRRLWSFLLGSDDATAKVEVVPASEIEGMRKVKHLTVSCSAEVDTGSFYWALVYVPQGTTPGNITVNIVTGTGGMYEPNQFVMNCGVVDPSAGPIRFSSPVARNLC